MMSRKVKRPPYEKLSDLKLSATDIDELLRQQSEAHFASVATVAEKVGLTAAEITAAIHEGRWPKEVWFFRPGSDEIVIDCKRLLQWGAGEPIDGPLQRFS